MPAPDPLKRYRLYIAMFLLNLALVVGVIYLLRRDQPRPVIITVLPTRPPTEAVSSAPAPASTRPAGSPATPTGLPTARPASQTKLDLNSATLEELQALPGIGPVLAQRILDFRSAHGRFDSAEQLKEVRGIGDAIYQEIVDLITVE